jgi:uncharacterized Tic20 family protein
LLSLEALAWSILSPLVLWQTKRCGGKIVDDESLEAVESKKARM